MAALPAARPLSYTPAMSTEPLPLPDPPLPTADQLFDLTGRCALITGAARGIGLAMARALAGAGCGVAVQDIDEPAAAAAAAAITAAGGRAVALGGDLCDLTLPARLIPAAAAALGGLHILINNGSIQLPRPWLDVPAEEIERQFRADLVSPILFCQLVVPIFRRQRFGRIINLGSVQQRKANPGMLAYSIAKGGLEKLTQGLARELAPDQITVNQIAPGWINHTVRNEPGSVDAGADRSHGPPGRTDGPPRRAGRHARHGSAALLRRRGLHHRPEHLHRRGMGQ